MPWKKKPEEDIFSLPKVISMIPGSVKHYEKGGYGLEGQWVDDFHHSVHTVLTGENAGYYNDYRKNGISGKSFQAGLYL